MKRPILSLLLGLSACADGPADQRPSQMDATGAIETVSDTNPQRPGGEGCEPGALSCADKSATMRCSEALEWGAPQPCASDEGCLNGYCRSALCSPGEVRCVSWTVRRECDASGLSWSQPQSCGTDEICHEGACVTCFPSEPTCATLFASAICSEDGMTFPLDDISSCGGEERCHEPSGVCLETTCEAGERRCAGTFGVHECLASETRFSPEVTPCEHGHVCSEGSCIEIACTPHPVLFLVDRTGAVGGDWASFQSAIEAAQDAYPTAAFGFMPFPMAFGCPEAGPGALPRFPIQQDADIAEWFGTVSASAGQAALEQAFQTLLDRAHEIFAGNPARVVLISSGDAECASDPQSLGRVVEALRLDHQIHTFVIGHRASSGPYDALDAIHAQGGSTWESWRETSYDLDLKQAINAAMEGTPACD